MRFGQFLFGVLALAVLAAWYLGMRDDSPVLTTLSMATLSLTSAAFEQNGRVPPQYTCDGENVSPPLRWSGGPAGTVSFALIMDDPDVPKVLRPNGVFDHWIVFNIPPETAEIAEDGPVPGIAGVNGAGKNAYTGPCPPPQYEPSEHRYIFRLYALDTSLPLLEGATKDEVLAAMEEHILASSELIGRYSRK